ncbi:MAG: hypothetical protein CMH27_07730 [Micavibrio sp.]|nr:hypothetical protein [Micavibrio sp.]|tara:strand:- start:209 stop:754 length:546 start_codon:yes stop_codon:yes gene_type:complete
MIDLLKEVAGKFQDVGLSEIVFLIIVGIIINFIFKTLTSAGDKTFKAVKKTSYNKANNIARENYVVIYKAIKNEGFLKHLEDIETTYYRKRVFLFLYTFLFSLLHIYTQLNKDLLRQTLFYIEFAYIDEFIEKYFIFLIVIFLMSFDGFYKGVQDRHGRAASVANRIKHDKNFFKYRGKKK